MKTDLVVGAYIIHKDRVLLIHHRKFDLWLPPGGHIEKDETPDDALLREIKEETGLNIKILNQCDLPLQKPIKRYLAIPFHTNVHSVGDHDHCVFEYLCEALNPEQLKINHELKNYDWFSREDLMQDHVPPEIKNVAFIALDSYTKLKK